MARKPNGHLVQSAVMLLFSLILLLGTSGCEVGRTMFQYQSGASSPWIGIDLLPKRKPRAERLKISHKATPDKADSQEINFAVEKKPEMKAFRKKPIRLNLPTSSPEKESPVLFGSTADSGTPPAALPINF